MENLPAIVAAWIVVIFIAAIASIILVKVWVGSISLSGLLSEPVEVPPVAPPVPGKGSLSRLQLLMFTFAIGGLYLTLSLEAGSFVDIPNQVLGLLGISGGSYVISKGIQEANK